MLQHHGLDRNHDCNNNMQLVTDGLAGSPRHIRRPLTDYDKRAHPNSYKLESYITRRCGRGRGDIEAEASWRLTYDLWTAGRCPVLVLDSSVICLAHFAFRHSALCPKSILYENISFFTYDDFQCCPVSIQAIPATWLSLITSASVVIPVYSTSFPLNL
ncbi:hypothetical protein J6590_061870 [Homalodisca vitripennis]|nr:hypothetical protein J6590_061870 [Homalodisca vitripennis]